LELYIDNAGYKEIVKSNKITISLEESKICKLDGLKFESSSLMIRHAKKIYGLSFEEYIIKCYYNDIRPTCLKTGNRLAFKAHKLGPWFSDTTKNCFDRKPHSIETREKIKIGCEKRAMKLFGVKNAFQSTVVKQKIRTTNLSKYGVDNPMKSEKFKRYEPRTSESLEKAKNTNFEKYGAITFSASDLGKLQIKRSSFKHYYPTWEKYVEHLNQIHLTPKFTNLDIMVNSTNKFECNIDKTIFESSELSPCCPTCEKNHTDCRSEFEREFCMFLDSIGLSYKTNKRFTENEKTYELDIFFPELKIGIELNGLYWHSELNGKGRLYHLNKLKFFNTLGYRVIQIIEDEWNIKRELIKSKICSILKITTNKKLIFTRKSEIKRETSRDIKLFMDTEHIQGFIPSTIIYSAYFDGTRFATMTFSKLRKSLGQTPIPNTYELLRFCVDKKITSTGIFGKLLSTFIHEFSPAKIISYADARFTDKTDNIYIKNKFAFVSHSKPGYWYIKGHKRVHRFGFKKQILVREGFDPTKSEWEIMKDRGYNRIWDCGQFKYELHVPMKLN